VEFPACHASALELFDFILESRIINNMKTVIETPTFQKQAEAIWTEDERLTFISWISQNPLAGDVIPGAEGARKVRWSVAGKGKRGGVRVIYFNMVEKDVIVLITLYQKSNQVNIKASVIKKAV
jgi:hypothetical protein